MTPAWTGGQYSVFRALFGAYLLVHFIRLMSFGTEVFSHAGMLAIGTLASIALLIGKQDRIAALVLWLVLAGLLDPNPLISNPGLPFVSWVLVVHAFIPTQPFGSWDARGRLDPDSGWRMPTALYTTAWIALALGNSYSGATKLISPTWIDGSALIQLLDDPLAGPTFLREALRTMPSALIAMTTWGVIAAELLFAPLALIARLRPWLWLALLGMHLALIALVDFADPSSRMILLHFFTFDPGWIAPRLPERQKGHSLIFYDGTCGLCHRTIRFLLAEDAMGLRFRFAPLDSDEFRSACAASETGFEPGKSIPDSVLVQRPGEMMLTRADGVLELGHQLGGVWRLLAIVVGWLPLAILNTGYDLIARGRHRLFTRSDDACPILSAHLSDRFQL